MTDPNRRGTLRTAAGFSLIELLVSALIFSILVVGYSSLFQYSLRSWAAAIARFEEEENVGIAINRVMSELHSAIPPYAQASAIIFKGYDAASPYPLTESDGDEIQCHVATTSSNEGVAGADPNNDIVATQFWRRTSTDGGNRLQRGSSTSSRLTYPVTLPRGAVGQATLATRVAGLSFEFWDGSNWLTVWDTTTDGKLPELIRITAVSTAFGGEITSQFVLRPMARGNYVTE